MILERQLAVSGSMRIRQDLNRRFGYLEEAFIVKGYLHRSYWDVRTHRTVG